MRVGGRAILAFCSLLMISCNGPRYINSSSPPNPVYFKQKGDAKLAGYLTSTVIGETAESEGSYGGGGDLQAAYAVTSYLAVSGAVSIRQEKDLFRREQNSPFFESDVEYRRRFADFGLGYFTGFNKRKKTGFTFFAGMGFGKLNWTDIGFTDQQDPVPYDRVFRANTRKIFFQPGLYFNPGDHFGMSLIQRFSHIRFTDVVSTYTEAEAAHFEFDEMDGRSVYFGELTLSLQAGIPGLRWLSIEGSATFNSQPQFKQSNLRARGFSGSIGICLNRRR